MPETANGRAAYMRGPEWWRFATRLLDISFAFWRDESDPVLKVKYEADFWKEHARILAGGGLYETSTSCCNAQVTYENPLTGWAWIRCPVCYQMTQVR